MVFIIFKSENCSYTGDPPLHVLLQLVVEIEFYRSVTPCECEGGIIFDNFLSLSRGEAIAADEAVTTDVDDDDS